MLCPAPVTCRCRTYIGLCGLAINNLSFVVFSITSKDKTWHNLASYCGCLTCNARNDKLTRFIEMNRCVDVKMSLILNLKSCLALSPTRMFRGISGCAGGCGCVDWLPCCPWGSSCLCFTGAHGLVSLPAASPALWLWRIFCFSEWDNQTVPMLK